MKKRVLALFAAAILGTTILAGCSGASTASTGTATPSADVAQEDVTNNVVSNANAGEAVADREVINVGIEADPGDLSPYGPSNTGKKDTLNCFYQPLAHTINGEIVGVLFDTYEIGGTEDKPYIEMHLYDYIHDQEGNAINANDIKFCLEKCQELGNNADVNIVESAEVIDDYTVRFNFKTQLYLNDINNVFDNLLIVSQKAYEASPDGMATQPVSTAHYKVTSFESGYKITAERDDNYWQTDETKIADRDKANVKQINYYILSEPQQMSLALENGSIDMSWTVDTNDIPRFTASDQYWLFQSPDNLCDLLDFNCTEGLATADVNLRTALYYSINQEAIIQSVYGGAAIRMYDCAAMKAPDAPESWMTEDNYYQFSVEKAKEYLDKWGGDPASLNLRILASNDTSTANEAQLIQGFFSAIGVTSQINLYDSAQFNTAMDSGDWDVLIFKNATAAYVPNLWKNIMDQNNYAWGGARNYVFDDTLQDLIVTARSLDGHTAENIQKAHEYIIENAYAYGICNFKQNYVLSTDISSVVTSFKGAVLPGGCVYNK